jgi:hypothetical protein
MANSGSRMKPDPFNKFLESARRGRPEESSQCGPGFSGRVVAQWAQEPENPWAVWEHLARRWLAAACVVCVAVAAVNYQQVPAPSALEDFVAVHVQDNFW